MSRRLSIMVRTFLLIMVVAFLAQSAAAATISYLGLQSLPNGDWRTTGTAKLAAGDPNGDNAYGNDGFHVFGISPDSVSLPSYITSVVVDGGVARFDNVPPIAVAPLDSPWAAIGNTVDDLTRTAIGYQGVENPGAYYNFFTITLAQDADFVLTTITGTERGTNFNGADGVKVLSGTSIAEVNTISGHDGNPDFALFRVSGSAGDTITVQAMTNNNGVPCMSGIAFESVPEPSTIILLLSAGVGLLAYAWRKRK